MLSQSLQSPLLSLEQLLYGKNEALAVITLAHLSFVLVAAKEGTSVSTGRDQFIKGVLDQRGVCEHSQRQVPGLEALLFHQLVLLLCRGALV